MTRYVTSVLGALLCAPGLAAQDVERFAFEHAAMGTSFRVVLYARDANLANEAATAAFKRVDALDQTLSDYSPASELSRLSNTAGTGQWVSISDDLWAVLAQSHRLAIETDGAFDVTIGSLTRLWRWANRRGALPDPERVAQAKRVSGDSLLEFDESTQRVQLTQIGTRLDVGAIGKGFAADEALDVLRQSEIRSALIDAGGDIVASGPPPGEPGWHVAVPALEAGTETTKTVCLADGAVATSGDAYRYVEVDGVRYSHIVDPATGLGFTTRRIATVLASSGADADALASAVSVLDVKQAIALLRRRPGVSSQVLELGRDGRWQTLFSSGEWRIMKDGARQ